MTFRGNRISDLLYVPVRNKVSVIDKFCYGSERLQVWGMGPHPTCHARNYRSGTCVDKVLLLIMLRNGRNGADALICLLVSYFLFQTPSAFGKEKKRINP
jgi:hypothetical protein